MTIIGIDLGTTNSLVTTYRDGEVVFIPNIYGDYLTPSAISIDEDGNVLVGKLAKERMLSDPENSIMSFKSFMGEDKTVLLRGKIYSAEMLSAILISTLIDDARRFLESDIDEVIISVPAYFDDKQRSATKRAGMMTGVKCERLINEPSAASLAYAHHNAVDEGLFLTFDFGGGTLDVTLVDVFGDMIEVIAISGDNKLGGKDVNEAIATNFLLHNNLGDLSNLLPTQKERLLKRSELAKVALDTEETVILKETIKGIEYTLEFGNDELMQYCRPMFQKMDKVVVKVLRDAQKQISDIDRVVLIGGSTKMPLIQEYLERLTGMEPQIDFEPDYSVAHGLGLVAGIKMRDSHVKDYILMDVCPFTLGINTQSGFSPIIRRNSSLPAKKTEFYVSIFDNQEKIYISVYQGENIDVSRNLLLDKFNVAIKQLPAGHAQISVTFGYDLNGILEVEVKSHSLNETTERTIIRDQQLSQSEIEIIKKSLVDFRDPVEEEYKYLIERANSYLEDLLYIKEQEEIAEISKELMRTQSLNNYAERLRIVGAIVNKLEEELKSELGLNTWDNHSSRLN